MFYSKGFCQRVIIQVDRGLPFLPSVDLSRIKAFTVGVVWLFTWKAVIVRFYCGCEAEFGVINRSTINCKPLKVFAWLFYSHNKSECRHVEVVAHSSVTGCLLLLDLFLIYRLGDVGHTCCMMWITCHLHCCLGLCWGGRALATYRGNKRAPGPPEWRVSPEQTELWIKGGRAWHAFWDGHGNTHRKVSVSLSSYL